jgi:hypothetical protein
MNRTDKLYNRFALLFNVIMTEVKNRFQRLNNNSIEAELYPAKDVPIASIKKSRLGRQMI